MSRWKAAAIHLSISAMIGIVAAILFLGVWYPPPYFHASGADELVLLLVGVDLCIGPLLTLILFRSGKKGLKFDLSAIAILQTIALIYGIAVVLVSRPIFLVGALDRFVLVSSIEISDDDLQAGNAYEFRKRSWSGPTLAGAKLPTTEKEKSDLISLSLSGRDLQNLPRYYVPFDMARADLLKAAKPMQSLRMKSPAKVDKAIAAIGRDPESLRWLPIVARKDDMAMIIDAESAQPIQALLIDPW